MRIYFALLIILAALLLVLSCSQEDDLLSIENNAAVEAVISFEDSSPENESASVKVLKSDSLLALLSTDENGYFKQDGLYEGLYEIRIESDFYLNTTTEIYLENNIITTLPADTLLITNSSLQGCLEFTNHSPADVNATIMAFYRGQNYAQVSTDDQGCFLLEKLVHGENRIKISATGFKNQDFSLVLDKSTLSTLGNIVLEEEITMPQRTINIDGSLDSGWEAVYTQDYPSSWGPNDFEALYMAYDDQNLYIALSGTFSSGDNTISICLDIDNSADTGINDFREVSGGDIGNNIRKEIDAPADFGADFALNTGWALNAGVCVSLADPAAVDQALLDNVNASLNTSVLEFSIPLGELYESEASGTIGLIGYIGGGGDQYFADDSIPQVEGGLNGTFDSVFKVGY